MIVARTGVTCRHPPLLFTRVNNGWRCLRSGTRRNSYPNKTPTLEPQLSVSGSPLGAPAMCCTVRDRHLEGGPGYSRFVRFIGIGVCNCAAPNDTPKRLHHRITLRTPAVSASSGIA